jgi:hypothetical protein
LLKFCQRCLTQNLWPESGNNSLTALINPCKIDLIKLESHLLLDHTCRLVDNTCTTRSHLSTSRQYMYY